MNDEQIKDIIITLINNEKLCSFGTSGANHVEKNTDDIIKAYKILKKEIGCK